MVIMVEMDKGSSPSTRRTGFLLYRHIIIGVEREWITPEEGKARILPYLTNS